MGDRPFRDIATSKAAFAELQKIGYIRYEDLPLEDVNGVRRQVEFVSNVYQENGRKAIQCNIRDITKRKGLNCLRDVARRKDEFLAMLGHELRNPLAESSTVSRCSSWSCPTARMPTKCGKSSSVRPTT